MYLKCIEIQGFKSFADKIFLEFNQGITAIVGPNGSGKSNISDAIRWVMGEQSVKTLRGGKMEDVIFAGTQTRKALGFAEVSLTLDNSENLFPIDFSEVTVTRRVYRSGESEFYINKSSCRLKDIHELFMDTGLGREGYSVIGQGRIDEILSNKSEDRRQVFEEAAGITKYKYRKNEAEKKLSQTTENLIRLKDILAELEGQIEPLKAQSEKAKKYLSLREGLKSLEIGVTLNSIDSMKEDLSKTEKSFKALNSHIEVTKNEIESTEKSISELYEELNVFDENINKSRNKENEIINSINEIDNQINLFLNTVKYGDENISRLDGEIENAKLIIADTDKKIEETKGHLEGLTTYYDKVSIELNDVKLEFTQKSEIANDKTKYLEGVKSQKLNLSSLVSGEQAKIENLNLLKENYLDRKNKIESETNEKASEIKELNETTENLRIEIGNKKELEESLKDELQKDEKKYNEITKKHQGLSQEKDFIRLEISKNESQKNILLDMEKEFEGYGKSVKSIMKDYEKGILESVSIHGPLNKLIDTADDYVTAIEIALGPAGQNIVVETENDAKSAIEYLKKNRLGRATFLPISSVKGQVIKDSDFSNCIGFISIASNLINCDERYRGIVNSLLGRTVVADNIDSAIKLAREFKHRFKIVTLSGEVIQAGGAMTGGSIGRSSGFLSRAKEIDRISAKIESDELKFDSLIRELDISDKLIENKALSMKEKESKISSLTNEIIRLSSDYAHYNSFAESIENSKTQLKSEFENISKQIEKLELEVKNKKDVVRKTEKELIDLEEVLVSVSTDFTDISRESDRLSKRLIELNIEQNNIFKDIEVQNEKIENLKNQKESTFKGIQSKQDEITVLKSRNCDMTDDIEFKKEQINQYNEELKSARQNLENKVEEKQKAENKIKSLQAESKVIREKLFSLTEKQLKTENRKVKIELELENLINRMWEEYEVTYNEALSLNFEQVENASRAKKDISDLKARIKELGNINVNAIEEYKNVKERYDFLTEQTQDLESGKKNLEIIIDEMLKTMQEQFSGQFKIINKQFNNVFKRLFGGGYASLSLSDPKNILESGIEIAAQPPGKKLQSLTLLSGGERAFTAIALLFAILEVRPTPFCILDEIEAALDDANVHRFADYLKKYSKKTQFIVVTHRRGTMEIANILYGVTMQERGISKLLSLNIDEVAK